MKEEARRLFHGRGKGLLYSVDFIPPYILIDSFEDISEEKLEKIINELPVEAEGIFYRNRKSRLPFKALKGLVPKKHYLIENELKYEVDFSSNQNIGFFMDMKPGRELIEDLCHGKTVLNLFSYTCSFSVAAKRAGAARVTNIDMKKSFLKIGQKNHQLNNDSAKGVSFLSYDIMKSLSGIAKKGPWDLIIIDPPSVQSSFKLELLYPKLLKRAKSWLTKDGKILACLNAPFLSTDFLLEHNPGLEVEKKLYGSFEEINPEKGLKMVLFTQRTS